MSSSKNLITSLILNDKEQETLPRIPRKSDTSIAYWTKFYRTYSLVPGVAAFVFSGILAASVMVATNAAAKHRQKEIDSDTATALIAVSGLFGLAALVGTVSNVREAIAGHILYRHYYREKLNREIQREKSE